MIYRDDKNYPVDKTGDGMDSFLRAAVLSFKEYDKNIEMYFDIPRVLLRHPYQSPANNPKNLSRDNMLPGIAGFNNVGLHSLVKKIFYSRMREFFFCQNTERDKPGSTKYMWPHFFFKDSNPIAHTQKLCFNEIFWYLKGHRYDTSKEVEFKWFDCADILMPNHIGALIIAGRVWPFYWFLPIATAWHLCALILNRWSTKEQNQIICEASIYKTLHIYAFMQTRYKELLRAYWGSRDEIEYAEILIEYIKKTRGLPS